VDADYARAYAHLGVTYYVRRNYEAAIPNLKHAVDLGLESEEYFYEIGLAYAFLDECDQAVPWLDRALTANPNSELAQTGINICAEQKNSK